MPCRLRDRCMAARDGKRDHRVTRALWNASSSRGICPRASPPATSARSAPGHRRRTNIVRGLRRAASMKGREEPVRLAHLISHPIQYFAPLYRELSRRPEVDLTVYYYSDATTGAHLDVGFGREIAWDADLLGGYRSRFLPSSRDVQPDSGQRRAHLDLLRELASERYDAIWIHGYAHVANWLAAVVAAATRTKVLLRDEQTLLRPRSWRRRIVKRVVLSPLFGTSLCLFIGAQNRRHFEHFGARRLFPTPYCVDNDYFGLAAARLAAGRDAIRSAWGLGGAPVVLFAGKLVDYKQ